MKTTEKKCSKNVIKLLLDVPTSPTTSDDIITSLAAGYLSDIITSLTERHHVGCRGKRRTTAALLWPY